MDDSVEIKPKEKPMAYQCACCDELFDGEAEYAVMHDCRFEFDGKHLLVLDQDNRDWCEGCFEDHVISCSFTGYYFSEHDFDRSEDSNGNDVCLQAVQAAGWVEDDEGYWRPPTKEEQKMATKYVDFYWQLDKGERHGVLQIEDGGEEPMSSALEDKIYHRIEEAGADKGDPSVVNTYTRLQLIDDGILPADYVL